jgi:hypothetical protein
MVTPRFKSSATRSRGTRDSKDKPRFGVPPFRGIKFINRTVINYTSWLLVRYAPGDTGARPLPSGAVFWESPDVWVESSLGINQPVVGQPNRLFARVTNLGFQYATGVTVKFWWADPSLAITETTANLVGFGSADIPSGWSVIIPCRDPWIPVQENGGHECLIAEAYIPKFDPLSAPMDPVDDRHVGQKNEQLVTLAPGESFKINVNAVNVLPLAQELTLQIQPLRMATLPPLLAARTAILPVKLQPPSAVLPVALAHNESAAVYTGPSTMFARRLLRLTQQATDGAVMDCSAPVQVSHTARFEPWESRAISVTGNVPSGAKTGQTFGFRIVQRCGNVVTGGYTVYVVVLDR